MTALHIKSIKSRIIIGSILVSIVPMLFLAVISYSIGKKQTVKDIENTLSQHALTMKQEVQAVYVIAFFN